MKHICFLSIGSNLGDRFLNIHNAISRLSDSFNIIKTSSCYYTESWGYKDDDYMNCILKMETILTPVLLDGGHDPRKSSCCSLLQDRLDQTCSKKKEKSKFLDFKSFCAK